MSVIHTHLMETPPLNTIAKFENNIKDKIFTLNQFLVICDVHKTSILFINTSAI